MKEHIEREAVLSVLDEAVKTWRPDIGISKAEYLRIRYKNLPAADVMEVGKLTEAGKRLLKYCPEVINQMAAQVVNLLDSILLHGDGADMREAPCDAKERKEPRKDHG